MNGPVLVVGVGNTLRGDDGAGWRAVASLASDPRLAGARLLTRHQLTPELAADLAGARMTVLIDARTGGQARAGTVSVHRVDPGDPPRWSHHLDPSALAGLTQALYGTTPPVFLVTITGVTFGHGDQLSAAAQQALLEIPDIVAALAG